MIEINSLDRVKEVFEDSHEFLKQHRSRRAFGGDNISQQLYFDDVKFTTPIIIGQLEMVNPSVTNLRRITGTEYYSVVPHIVFAGGDYSLIHFSSFKSHTMHDGPILNQQGQWANEVDLNIQFVGGTFKGPIRFTHSRIGNITFIGGVFEEPVVLDRGVYGIVSILGGEFKKGIYLGKNNLFTNEQPFLPPPTGFVMPVWTSTYDGIFSQVTISKKNEGDVTVSSCIVRNNVMIDSKDAQISLSGVVCQGTIEIQNGKLNITNAQCDNFQIGQVEQASKLQLSVASCHTNTLTLQGLFTKDTSAAISTHRTNAVLIVRHLNQGSVVFNQLVLSERRENFAEIFVIREAQRLNLTAFQRAAFHNSGSPHWADILQSYEPALREVPTVPQVEVASTITINNSDLGKMTFLNCALSALITFRSSRLTEISLISTLFPVRNWSQDTTFAQQREALFQLAKVYEAGGDSHQARFVKAAEFEAQRLELESQGYSEEGITLWLNQNSNRHGQSWWQALKWLFRIAGICWLVVLPFFKFNLDISDDLTIFLQSVSYFLEFLNPIHKFGFMEDYAIKVAGYKPGCVPERWLAIANTVDVVWRVACAYLIYQFIFAFRKHGRR
jgi:hypothetical protein